MGSEQALQHLERGVVERDGLVVAYRVVRSARRRRTIELTLERDGVRVAAPLRTPRSEIDAFVHDRVPWIRRHRERAGAAGPRSLTFAPDVTETVPYLGRSLPLELVTGGRRPRVELDLLGLRLTVPASVDASTRREVAEGALRLWYRARATDELRYRLDHWARMAGYAPRRLLVRDQRRRWGSCAPDGTIRLNWRLVMLPPALVDYVIVHELAHLVRPHHRPSFWAEVARMVPDYATRRRALRSAGAALPPL